MFSLHLGLYRPDLTDTSQFFDSTNTSLTYHNTNLTWENHKATKIKASKHLDNDDLDPESSSALSIHLRKVSTPGGSIGKHAKPKTLRRAFSNNMATDPA